MISKMERVHLCGPRSLLLHTTAVLQDLGTVHIDTPVCDPRWGFRPLVEDEEKAARLGALESLLERCKRTLLLLPPPGPSPHGAAPESLDPDSGELPEFLSDLLAKAEALHARHKKAGERITLLEKYEQVIETLAPLMDEVPPSPYFDTIGITFEQRNDEILKLIERALDQAVRGDYRIFSAPLDAYTTAAVLVFSRRYSEVVRGLLQERDLDEIQLPTEIADLPLKSALEELQRQLGRLPEELRGARAAREAFSRRWHASLTDLKKTLEPRIQQLITTRKFLCSKYSFIIGGWVPSRELKNLEHRLETAFGGRVQMEVQKSAEDAQAPVQIRNSALVRPFEVFIRLLSPPAYGTIDPTPYFAFFFPIFFGLILGDIGYGLLVLLLSAILWRRTAKGTMWHDLALVLIICSFYTIFFGVLFGEFFATLGERFHLLNYLGRRVVDSGGAVEYHPLLYDRLKAMMTFLVIAVAIGVVHVFLGLLLGMVNALRTRRYPHLLLRGGMLLGAASAIFLVLALVRPFPSPLVWLAASVLAVALIGITFLEGIVAPIELISTMGNIVSYARIMAIGMASVIFGAVANRLGALPENVFLGILIGVVLHSINLVLGVFSPTIQSLRLHFVEFFGKFYEPGGRTYQPFRKLGGA